MALLPQLEDPLKKLGLATGSPVQNLGGQAPGTAPLAIRPVAAPAVNTGTPGAPQGLQPLQGAVQNSIRAGEQAPGTKPAPPALAPGAQAGYSTPAPAPAAPAPQAAAAPAPAPASNPLAASGAVYGSYGGNSAASGSLEDQLRNYITGGLSGNTTSKAWIDRARSDLGSAVEGQRAQAVNRVNNDAIKRGLFRSGIPAESTAAIDVGAKGAIAQGLSSILNQADQQNIAGRESAAGTAQNLLGMNRSWDQYAQQRADEQAAQAAAQAAAGRAAAGQDFTYIDPDTGQAYQMNSNWFGG